MFYLLQRFRNLLYMLLSVSFLQEHGARLGCFEQVLSVKALHIDCPNRFLFHNHCCSVNSKVHARSSLNLSHSCIKTCQFAPVALCSSSSCSTIVDNWPALFSYCPGRHGSHCRDLRQDCDWYIAQPLSWRSHSLHQKWPILDITCSLSEVRI